MGGLRRGYPPAVRVRVLGGGIGENRQVAQPLAMIRATVKGLLVLLAEVSPRLLYFMVAG